MLSTNSSADNSVPCSLLGKHVSQIPALAARCRRNPSRWPFSSARASVIPFSLNTRCFQASVLAFRTDALCSARFKTVPCTRESVNTWHASFDSAKRMSAVSARFLMPSPACSWSRIEVRKDIISNMKKSYGSSKMNQSKD
jgi:hypothetical protein